jgi:hypothetical protein
LAHKEEEEEAEHARRHKSIRRAVLLSQVDLAQKRGE